MNGFWISLGLAFLGMCLYDGLVRIANAILKVKS
jgi:hypothetical protein